MPHRIFAVTAGLLLGASLALPATAASVAVGRDLSVTDPSIVRVEVLGSENVVPGDPAALVSPFSGQNACITYVFDDANTLNQDVRLALFDANDNVLGLPIISVTNAYYNTVDAACGPVVIPNQPPIAVDDNFGTAFAGANVLTNDIDPDGDQLTASILTQPASGTITLAPTGTFTYTPVTGFSGTVTFTYEAFDGTDVSTSPGVVTFTVQPPANQAPVAVDDDFGTVISGANVLANDTDADGDPLTASLLTQPTSGTIVLAADGTFSYTPVAGFSGAVSFTYEASDGIDVSVNPGVVTFTVQPAPPVNRPPIAVDDNFGENYLDVSVLTNDSDPDGDALGVSLVSSTQNGRLTIRSNGSFIYTPDDGFFGSDSFTYQANDGLLRSNTATVTLLVVQDNIEPTAVDDNFGSAYDGANVLLNDSDPNDSPLTAILESPPANGSVLLNADGSFSYTPNDGYFGSDSFSYQADNGQLRSNTASVSLQVLEPTPPPNTAPIAVDDDFGSDLNGANVLLNDSDPDGDRLSAILENPPLHGTVQLESDGTFTYTPEIAYAGPDSFTYRASDGELESNVAVVSLVASLPDTNQPPVAVPDNFQGDYRTGNVLDNDIDPNQDQLFAILVENPENGTLELREDGTFTYLPFAGYSGADAFSYKARDRQLDDPTGLESAAVLVSLQVDPSEPTDGGVTNKEDEDGTSVIANASTNELRTSREIDLICPSLQPENEAQEDLLTLCTNLRAQGTSAKQALTALRAITPEELSAIGTAVRVLSFSRFRNIGARISRARDGSSQGISIAGLNVKFGDTQVSGSDMDKILQETLGVLGAGASADQGEDLLRENSKLGLFVRGDLSFGEQDETSLESGYDFDAQTITVGADYRLNDNLFTGASFSYGRSDVEFADDGGETHSDHYSLAVYGSLYSGSGYIDGILSYGWSEVETQRNIVYSDFGGDVDRVAKGDTDGSEYYISLNAGYNFNWGGLNIDPLARFFYLDGEIDPFQESGAGGWNLDIGEQGIKSTSMSAGGQMSYTLLPSWGVVTPYIRAEYTREFEDSADGVSYRFANAPRRSQFDNNELRIEPEDPDNSYFVYGAGVAAQFSHGISGFISYQALGSYDNLTGEIISFGMRWEAQF